MNVLLWLIMAPVIPDSGSALADDVSAVANQRSVNG